tara:strand:- start:456 stop:2018 length:1563 start_codon:yes stop_codon:yes gene_type:complete
MADLIDEIQELKLATIKGANESIEAGNLAAAQIQAQNATTNSIDILTETFKQFFKAERRDKEGDDLEASREAQGQVTKEGAMGAATGSDIEPLDFGGSYFAMIAGAIAGLATGLVGAIAGQIALVTGAIGRLFRLDKALAALKNSSKLFQARFMNFISKGGVGKFFRAISNTFANITKQFKAGFNSLKVARNSVGQFTKLGFFGRMGSFFNTLLKPFRFIIKAFADLNKTIRSVFGIVSKVAKGGGVLSKFFGTIGSFFRGFAAIGSKLLVPLQVVIGLFSGVKQAITDFTSTEGTIGDKLIAGLGGFVKGAFNALISMPLDLLKKGVSFIAGKLGFENFAELLDSFSFAGLFSTIFDGITGFVTGIKDIIVGIFTFDGDKIKKGLGGIGNILKGVGKFFLAVMAGGLAALGAILPGGESPGEAFTRKYKEVMAGGSSNVTKTDRGGKGGADIDETDLNKVTPEERQKSIEAAASRKESRGGGTTVIDASTNTNTSTSGDTLAMSGPPEPAVNPRKKSRG